MIKNIVAGPGLNINNNHSGWPSFYSSVSGTGNSLVGQLRYNGSSQNMEVYDGNLWITMAGSWPTIELNGEVQSVVNWAQDKMAEEAQIKELAAKHPAVADALEAVKKAQEQVRIVTALVDTE